VSEPPGPAGEGQIWREREGVLPERRDVEVRERVMQGGECVKRLAGAKCFESSMRCLSVAGAP
jgi:hypothetical protein